MSMLPADIHKRLDPDLIAVPTHDARGLPTLFLLDGVRVTYAPRKAYEAHLRTIGHLLPVENDLEDQGMTRISDGCFNWKCAEWDRLTETRKRPALVKRTQYGGVWWVCPKCGGSYGPAE